MVHMRIEALIGVQDGINTHTIGWMFGASSVYVINVIAYRRWDELRLSPIDESI